MKLKALLSQGLAIVTIAGLLSSPAKALEAACEGQKIVVFGDSLVAGYGLNPGEGFPEQLQVAIEQNGYDVSFVNAGVSGDTTSAGLARLDWSIDDNTDAVILELGANDALRGIAPELTRKNLDTMIGTLKIRGIDVLVAGMMAPPNMGGSYGKKFNSIFPELAEKHDVMLYPFFLEGVAADESLNQADGIHPTKEGIAVMVKNFMPTAKRFLKSVCRN